MENANYDKGNDDPPPNFLRIESVPNKKKAQNEIVSPLGVAKIE